MKRLIFIIMAVALILALSISVVAVGPKIIKSINKQIDETHSYSEAIFDDGTVKKRSTVEMFVSDDFLN